MKKVSLLFLSVTGLSLLFAKQALAICPICTIAVGAGVGFSRWLGIDDSIAGLWIGGLTVSMIMWTISWLDKKNIRFRGRDMVTAAGYYLLIVVPLYFVGMIANPSNAISFGWLDKLLLGITVGSLAFWSGGEWYYYLKEKNGGRAHFPFQKVVMPLGPIIVMSLIFYFLTK